VRLLEVLWRDAFSTHEEVAIGEWAPQALVHTIGYDLGTSDGYMHIAQEMYGPDRFQCVTHIPIEIVQAQVELRKAVIE
jgi:hypothetical protein